MEDEETLQTCALVSLMERETKTSATDQAIKTTQQLSSHFKLAHQFSDSVQNKINHFLSNCVMTTSIVVSGIFLASHQLFWVEKLSVCSSTNLIWKENA